MFLELNKAAYNLKKKQAWLEALAKEGKSHQDLKTMSEPIEAKDLPPGARRSPSTLLVR